MTQQKKQIYGAALLLAALVLAGASYASHSNYMKALGRTISLPSGFSGPLTDTTPVQVQLFGPQARAADRAKAIRNTLIGGTMLAWLAGTAFVVAGRKRIP